MFERFSAVSRAVIDESQRCAANLSASEAGSEHLLLAIASIDAGTASELLARFGVVDTAAHEQLSSRLLEWDSTYKWNTEARCVLELSLRCMLDRAGETVEPEDILLAIAQTPRSNAGQILAALDVSHRDLVLSLETPIRRDESVWG